MDLLLGTSNPAKVERLGRLLADLPLRVRLPAEFGPAPAVVEGVDSLEANAGLKASAWARGYQVPTLATDGGLLVPALGVRWNPALTRRAAGEHATDEQRAQHLLALAADLRGEQRAAWQVEALALAEAGGSVLATWEARSAPRYLAETYDPTDLPAGFWLPGVLLYGPERRTYRSLSDTEQVQAEDHWLDLGPPIRAALQRLARSA